MDKIIFRRLNEPFGEFSNFYPSLIRIGGKEYRTVEHYYQSMKFKDTEYEEPIRNRSTPKQAKELAYSEEIQRHMDKKWHQNKLLIMGRGLSAKFQLPRFQNILLSTGTVEIVEYSKHDYYWGRNEDGAGYNMLGKLLMELRERIKIMEENQKYF